MKVLFVCRGNVGRSQIAEALLKKVDSGRFEVSSAGTKLSGPEQPIGELMPAIKEVLDVMNEVGIDVSHNIRRQVTEEMANDADKIILVVDDNDPIPDYLTDNSKVIRWDVLDPKGKDLEFTRNVRNQITDLIKLFVADNK